MRTFKTLSFTFVNVYNIFNVCLNAPLNPNQMAPLSQNHDFSGTEPPLDLRPVCKLKFVRCGPGEKKQSALSFLVEAWRPDEVREHLFPNSEIEIFIDFC